jgi:uncharacterized protein
MNTCQTMNHKAPVGIMWKTVSEDCNLACDYCYYSTCQGKPGAEIRRIDDELLHKVIGQMMESSQGSVSFAWQGGEPLLAGLPFFEKVVQLQAHYATRNTIISNALQTNGTLLNAEWASFFKKYSFLIGVSVDGPQWIHDKRRKTGSGAGSYARVMQGIEFLRKEHVDFNILTVVHEDNVGEAAALMDWLEQNQFDHVQFIPCMDFRSQDIEAEGRYLITPKQYGQFLCELFDSWYRDGNPLISVRVFDNWLQKLVGQEPELCVHRQSCPSMLILEQNGDAYPCDFYIHDSYRLGNVGEDSLIELMNKPVWDKFHMQKGNLAPSCLKCEYLHYCHGGCPRNRIGHETIDQPGIDYFCESYRVLYKYGEERMRKLARMILERQGRKLPERNERCICGSGKKAKQCCG